MEKNNGFALFLLNYPVFFNLIALKHFIVLINGFRISAANRAYLTFILLKRTCLLSV